MVNRKHLWKIKNSLRVVHLKLVLQGRTQLVWDVSQTSKRYPVCVGIRKTCNASRRDKMGNKSSSTTTRRLRPFATNNSSSRVRVGGVAKGQCGYKSLGLA